MTLPALTPFASQLYYERTAPLARQDAQNDFAWAVLCAAMATMFDPLEFVRDSPDGPGYSSLLDVDRAPSDGLGWLAMFAGVVTIDRLTDQQNRERIDATAGFQIGTVASIVAAAQTHLTGTKRVVVYERDAGNAYALRVVTFAAETPDPVQTAADVRAAKPAGLLLTMQVLAGWLINEMEAFYVGTTIAAGPEAGFATLDAFESRVV